MYYTDTKQALNHKQKIKVLKSFVLNPKKIEGILCTISHLN
jgi:hypothetical protein